MKATATARRILVVTDLGPAGRAAITAGAARARALGAKLAVVHTMPSLDMVRPVFPERVADDVLRPATLPDLVRAALARQIAIAAPDGPDAEILLETGGSAEMALQAAGRWRADLVVTGAPEEDVLDVERIVRHALVPVLIVRPVPAQGAVVACTDFSDPALPAVAAAAAEAKRSGDPLCVIHALEPVPATVIGIEGYGIVLGSEWQMERRRSTERRLARVLAALEVDGRYVAADGSAVATLVAAARELQARLLVIGAVGRTGLTRFLLGSVAEALVRAAPCSTLVVRLQGAESPEVAP